MAKPEGLVARNPCLQAAIAGLEHQPQFPGEAGVATAPSSRLRADFSGKSPSRQLQSIVPHEFAFEETRPCISVRCASRPFSRAGREMNVAKPFRAHVA